MSTIFGSFVFRDEGDGCITSKYLEHNSQKPFPESSIRLTSRISDPFEGDYETTWLEPGNRTAKLSIRKTGNVYQLEWTNISGSSSTYKGKGMLVEGKLVGSYWI